MMHLHIVGYSEALERSLGVHISVTVSRTMLLGKANTHKKISEKANQIHFQVEITQEILIQTVLHQIDYVLWILF